MQAALTADDWCAPTRKVTMISRNRGVVALMVMCSIVILGILITSRFKYKNSIKFTMMTVVEDGLAFAVGSVNDSKAPKIILFWTKFYTYPTWRIKGERDSVCGQYTCFLTYNKSLYDRASALMFHHRTDWLLRLPTDQPRIPWQRWVLYNRESSWWGPKGDDLNKANDLINWTMGFRKDNDVTIPTAKVWKGQFKEGFDPDKNYLASKTGEVAALLSAQCIAADHPGYTTRRKYLDVLMKHGLKVETYGRCGKQCGGSCAEALKNFKFVLALENSLCDEYISEKAYRNGLLLGVVPIIMSGANLSDPYILPPGSFIDASEFSSVTALVAFLGKVGSDPQLYNKYFEWRKDWDFQLISENEGLVDFTDDYFCPLCTRLHENHPPKSIRNLQYWFEQEKCWLYPTMSP